MIIDRTDSITIVTFPDSNLDASNNRDFMASMAPMLSNGAQVIFDMNRFRFIDSSGLGSITLCLRRLKASGGLLILCDLSKSVQALFELVRMHKIFDVYTTKEEAIKAFRS